MSKIQILQLIAVVTLVVFVVLSYQRESTVTWLFYFIVVVNIVLWIFRLLERRQKEK